MLGIEATPALALNSIDSSSIRRTYERGLALLKALNHGLSLRNANLQHLAHGGWLSRAVFQTSKKLPMGFEKFVVLLQSLQLSATLRSYATRVLTVSKGSCMVSILSVAGIAQGRCARVSTSGRPYCEVNMPIFRLSRSDKARQW